MPPSKEKLTGKALTRAYEPPVFSGLGLYWFHGNRPFFHRGWIESMLSDPRIDFGLSLLKGPILSQSKFWVECDHEEAKQYIIKQIVRFWRTSAALALRSLDYGFIGCEVLYQIKEGTLQYDTLKFLHPADTQVVTKDGEYIGIQVKNARGSSKGDEHLFIRAPKAFWAVHKKDWHRWYGRSRLFGAFLPWHEIWSQGGYRDQRRLWFFKNAFNSGSLQFPDGSQQGSDGTIKSNSVVAREILDLAKSGHSIAFPKGADPSQDWVYEPPKAIGAPEGLLEYGDSLRDEIWEGMGIPTEVARAEGTGAFAGRAVPQEAFFSVLQEIVQALITDVDEQIIRNLVNMRFGDIQYEIETFGLIRAQEQADIDQSGFGGNGQEGGLRQPVLTGPVLSPQEKNALQDQPLMYKFKVAQ